MGKRVLEDIDGVRYESHRGVINEVIDGHGRGSHGNCQIHLRDTEQRQQDYYDGDP